MRSGMAGREAGVEMAPARWGTPPSPPGPAGCLGFFAPSLVVQNRAPPPAPTHTVPRRYLPRAPLFISIRGEDKHPRPCPRPFLPIDDPHLVIRKRNQINLRIEWTQRFP